MRYRELMQLIAQYGADREAIGQADATTKDRESLEDAAEEKLMRIRGVVRKLYVDAGEES